MKSDHSLRDSRHIDKIFYLGHSKLFYELNVDHYEPSEELLRIAQSALEIDQCRWFIGRDGVWTHVTRVDDSGNPNPLPKQGWKIHISATNRNSPEILKRASAILVKRGTTFKFANDIETLTLMTSKRWHRGGSGKFITVYPKNDSDFKELIEILYRAMEGLVGSYILSDRRYKDSKCVYYRYGGIIAETEKNFMGQRSHVLYSPTGEKIPDQRNPYFELPHWIKDPFPEDEETDADMGDEIHLNEGRYRIEKAIGFSNTGGVYLAHDNQQNKQVVVKEARPGVELSPDGEDAVARLEQEANILRLLSGEGLVPEVYDTFWDWENFYIAIEYLDADPMRIVMLKESPLLHVWPTLQQSRDYYHLYKKMFVDLLKAVQCIHAKGIVIGDLSPVNIMIDKHDKTVRLIDLEGAYEPSSGQIKDLHTPGFRPHIEGRAKGSGFENDLYAIGAIILYSIFPLAAMSFLRRDLYEKVLPILVADAGWADTNVVEVGRRLVANEINCEEAIALMQEEVVIASPMKHAQPSLLGTESALPLPSLKRQLTDFIVNTVRLDEKFTTFPIDPFGKDTNPLGLGFGSSGILHVLQTVGADIPADALGRERARFEKTDLAEIPPGFIVGTAGMAWTRFSDGRVNEAEELLRIANESPLSRAHYSLYYGLAGIGLTNLKAYDITKEQAHLDRAITIGEELRAMSKFDPRGIYWESDGATSLGFAYGQSGVALFLLRLSQASGIHSWRELGEAGLRYDISYGHELEPGVASFASEPQITHTYEPYIEVGTAGIAKVALRYGLDMDIDRLLANAHRKYSSFPGLIYGLTGFVDVLVDAYIYTGNQKYLEWAERPLRGLYDLYLFKSDHGFAVPGENLFRVSCDYATGLAGIVATLGRRIDLTPDEFCLDGFDR